MSSAIVKLLRVIQLQNLKPTSDSMCSQCVRNNSSETLNPRCLIVWPSLSWGVTRKAVSCDFNAAWGSGRTRYSHLIKLIAFSDRQFVQQVCRHTESMPHTNSCYN